MKKGTLSPRKGKKNGRYVFTARERRQSKSLGVFAEVGRFFAGGNAHCKRGIVHFA